jgi:hypothetical protein
MRYIIAVVYGGDANYMAGPRHHHPEQCLAHIPCGGTNGDVLRIVADDPQVHFIISVQSSIGIALSTTQRGLRWKKLQMLKAHGYLEDL